MSNGYHISPETGRANVCRATKRDCPVGGEHFATREEAQLYIETLQPTFGEKLTKKGKSQEKFAALYVKPKAWGDLPEEASEVQLAAAKAYAAANQKYTPVSYRKTEEEESYYDEDYRGDTTGYRGTVTMEVVDGLGNSYHIETVATTDSEYDEGMRYYPNVTTTVKIGEKIFRINELHPTVEEKLLRNISGNSSRMSYDHWSYSSTKRKAQELLTAGTAPYLNAKIARAELIELPAATATRMADDADYRVRSAVARNAGTPKIAVAKLQDDPSVTVRNSVASRSDLTVAQWKKALGDTEVHRGGWRAVDDGDTYNRSPRTTALSNPDLPEKLLLPLVKKLKHDEIRYVADGARARRQRGKDFSSELFAAVKARADDIGARW